MGILGIYSTNPARHLYAEVEVIFGGGRCTVARRADGGLETSATGAVTLDEKRQALDAFRAEEGSTADGRTYVRNGELSAAVAGKDARRYGGYGGGYGRGRRR